MYNVIEISIAPNKEIIESSRAWLSHPSGIKKAEQFITVITPLEKGRSVKTLQLFKIFHGTF